MTAIEHNRDARSIDQHSLLDHVPDAILVKNEAHRRLMANGAFREPVGAMTRFVRSTLGDAHRKSGVGGKYRTDEKVRQLQLPKRMMCRGMKATAAGPSSIVAFVSLAVDFLYTRSADMGST